MSDILKIWLWCKRTNYWHRFDIEAKLLARRLPTYKEVIPFGVSGKPPATIEWE